MTYCTNADVLPYVGSAVLTTDLDKMIADADRRILAHFTKGKCSVDSETAKTASILLTRAAVAEMFYLTGVNPTSYSSGDFSQSGAADQLALSQKLTKEAFDEMNTYIRASVGVRLRRTRT